MLRGYEEFRAFDDSTLSLIEVMRALRYVRYAAWVAARWDDPAFQRAFPHWGTEAYWQGQLADVHEQLAVLEAEDGQVNW
jgi:Ser/Thr protein kinase RdoA (MazF antagonist)